MEYQVKTKTSLPRKDEQVYKKKPNIGKTLITTVSSVLISIAFGFGVQFVYDLNRYDPFIVDGESMYPLLNYDTKITYNDGTTFDDPENAWSLGDFKSGATYICDYCLMDSSEGFENKIQRFDIVITYYPNDYIGSTPREGSSLKVKRVIGMPGETVKFDSDGALYIKGKGESDYKFVDQYFLNYDYNHENRPKVTQEWYERAMKETTNGRIITEMLDDDEYYLVGDNRRLGASLDSRSNIVGPINAKCLVGRAVASFTKCKYVPGEQPQVIITKDVLPWRTKEL